MARERRASPRWARLTDEELLDLRFCDLGLEIRGSALERRVAQLYDELARRGLRFRPHCWLAEEWFSPDRVPGIAIPFFLAHPRLAMLEYRQMFDVEGGTDGASMRLLRHEAGHAIDSGFRLHERKRWQQVFGNPKKPYPASYTPRPQSRRFVLHLEWWYAQSHQAEDFAETFAVWLRPRAQWRKTYTDWPALEKLEYVDELMRSIEGRAARVRSRRQVESVSRLRTTLREHYEAKRRRHEIEVPEVYDRDLLRLFGDPGVAEHDRAVGAASFLAREQADLCRDCSRGTGEHPYAIAQILREMTLRCRELELRVHRPLDEVRIDVAIFLSVQTVNYLHDAHHRIPM